MRAEASRVWLNIFADSSNPGTVHLTLKWDDGTAFTFPLSRPSLRRLADALLQYDLSEKDIVAEGILP